MTVAKRLLFAIKLLHEYFSTKSIEIDEQQSDESNNEMKVEIPRDSNFATMLRQRTINTQLHPKISKFLEKVKFQLWTQSLDSELFSTAFKLYDESTIESIWLPEKPLKVIIHGWLSSAVEETGIFMVTKAYAEQISKYNVISVDWSAIAGKFNYVTVANACNKVGAIVGQLLINLEKVNLVKPAMIHVIGHSLGAHIAGLAGSGYMTANVEKIARITALDPPSPGFVYASLWLFFTVNDRVDKEHAVFVDVIKTTSHLIGINTTIGHAEFHPNNASAHQPGCYALVPFNYWICSHKRAFEYYRESVYSCCVFESLKCTSMKDFKKGLCKDAERSYMGHCADSSARGNYYLHTNGKSPYSASLPTWEDVEESRLETADEMSKTSSSDDKTRQ